MTLENPEKIIQFPKIKRMGSKFDRKALKEVIQKNMSPLEELKAGEKKAYREFKKTIPRLSPDFDIAKGGKK